MDKETSIIERARATDASSVYVLPSSYSFGDDDEYVVMEEWLSRFKRDPSESYATDAEEAEIDAIFDEFEMRFGPADSEDHPEDKIYEFDPTREYVDPDDCILDPNAPGM